MAVQPPDPSARTKHLPVPWLGLLLLVSLGWAAYSGTFSAPFIFDDIPALGDLGMAQDVGQPSTALTPPLLRGTGVAGRPIVAWSLALNRAISGNDVWSYHAFNLVVHLSAGMLLFGLLRRTLAVPRSVIRSSCERDTVALASSAIWLVHPLQTESVTCVIQRTESLCGLFFFLTFYAFVRAATSVVGEDSRRSRIVWLTVSVAAALVGASTKEVMAVAPILLLLFDRTFVARSFAEAWRMRRGWYVGFLFVWLVVAVSVWRSDVRGGTVGFGHGVSAWQYALTQFRAVTMYFKLAVWPHPLVLDYGTDVVRGMSEVWPQALALGGLVAITVWALYRRPVVGFLAAWTFVILAPSSSVVPLVTQTMAEHRMYLPLAGIVVLAVLGGRAVSGRYFNVLVTAMTLALAVTTFARNREYRSAVTIWEDNIAKWPTNPRAHYTLAQLADQNGDSSAAIRHGEAAVRLLPNDATALFNLAFSYTKAGQLEKAATTYRSAVTLKPGSVDARINLGAILVRLGRLDEAITEYENVVRLKPESGEDQFNLAQTYALAGRITEAISHYELAVKLTPRFDEAHYRMGNAWLKLQRYEEAARRFRETIEINPSHFEAHVNLAGALVALGRPDEAIPVYEAALRLRPGDPTATANLARARAAAGR